MVLSSLQIHCCHNAGAEQGLFGCKQELKCEYSILVQAEDNSVWMMINAEEITTDLCVYLCARICLLEDVYCACAAVSK